MRAVVLLILVAAAGVLYADARDDLSRVKNDLDSLKSRLDDTKSKADKYLEQSTKLREMDKEQLAQLVEQICKLDIARDGDEIDRLAKELRDKIVDRVRREYDRTVDDGGRMIDQIERVMNDAKSLRDRAKDLKGREEIKDDASRVFDDIGRTVELIDRLMEKVQSDRKTLDRIKEGVMAGANNPTIRARMEYGKQKHRELQSSRNCDEKETVLSSGRPDCIKFAPDACVVIEFKPDTYSTSAAKSQAEGYLRDVRDKFKNDDRAKRCRQTSDGPFFEAVGETYPACRL